MPKKYIKVFYDWTEVTATLSDAEKGRLITALVGYARSGEEIELSGAERHLFPMFRAQIDRDEASYQTSVSNGRQGGAPIGNHNATTQNNLNQPKAPKINQDKDKEEEEDKDKDKDKEKESKEKEKRAAFRPPSLDDVKKYCQERKNDVNPSRFIDFYASKGWYVGKNKMKDWKAAVRTWEQKDAPKSAKTDLADKHNYSVQELSEVLFEKD